MRKKIKKLKISLTLFTIYGRIKEKLYGDFYYV